MTPGPSTVTIMFTDLVGSSALADRLGDIEAQALRRGHDRILKHKFDRFGGRVIKGTGDGFMVAFESARRAVECGIEIQSLVAVQHAEGRYADLHVRIGLHTGEPVSEGQDLLGSDVDLAARIQGEAAGGDVVVSQLTQLLAARSPGLEFEPLGDRVLKGFARPIPLFRARRSDEAKIGQELTRFIGRERETAILRDHLERAVRGKGGLVLVAGEPGVGKTRFVSELAIYAADRGLEVMSGRAYQTEGMPPYLPLIEPLSRYIETLSAQELRSALGSNASDLAKILPELRRRFPDLPEPPILSPEGERYRLFTSISDFLLKIAARGPLLLWLDDLHWADEASLLLIQHLAPRLTEAPILVVGGYRITEAQSLTELLSELRRQRLGTVMHLNPLDREESESLLEAVIGRSPAPQVAETLYEASEGNPFFLEELVWHLREERRDLTDPTQAREQWDIPEGVRQVIAGRLARLGDKTARLLVYASVLGRDLSLAKVAAVSGFDQVDALELLEEAMASHVLREAPEGYAFAHPLIRETLYQGLTATRRRQLHSLTAEELEKLYGADLEPPQLVELAHHFFQAAAKGEDVEKALSYATRAADRALAQVAWEEAARLYRMALEALALKKSPDERQRCELLLAMGEAQVWSAHPDKAQQVFQEAVDLARKLKNPEVLARAVLGYVGPPTTRFRDTDERVAIGLMDEALQSLRGRENALHARVLARLADALVVQSDPHEVLASRERIASLNAQALEMARRVGESATLSYVLQARHEASTHPANLDDRLAIATELLRLGEETGDTSLKAVGHAKRYENLLEVGDFVAVERHLQAWEQQLDELKQPMREHVRISRRAMRALFEGRYEDAERTIEQVRALDPARIRGYLGVILAQMFALRREQGRLQEQADVLGAAAEQNPGNPLLAASLAMLYSELGREPEARAQFERIAADDFRDLMGTLNALPVIVLISQVCAYLGDSRRAAILYELLRPYSARNVVMQWAVLCFGCAARYLGLLATTMRRWEDAERHFEDALEMNAKMATPPWLAWTQHDYATMLLARRGPGDRKKAYALLKQALDTAQELGMNALEDRTRGLIASRRGLAPNYPDNLSRREVEVLRLIADGKTGAEIAEQLFLSPRTVERHITNLYSKIGARTRVDAAAYAVAHGLTLPASK